MIRRTALVLAMACLLPAAASADPKAIANYLQHTQASLMQLSLAQLSNMVNAYGMTAGYGAFADYEDGDIVIRAYSATAKPDEKSCKRILDRIRRTGGVDPATGAPGDPASAYASLFSYDGEAESKIDTGYAETVDSMFSIMVVIGETGDGKGMVCKGRLLSNQATFERQ